jgi:hypothetical protein
MKTREYVRVNSVDASWVHACGDADSVSLVSVQDEDIDLGSSSRTTSLTCDNESIEELVRNIRNFVQSTSRKETASTNEMMAVSLLNVAVGLLSTPPLTAPPRSEAPASSTSECHPTAPKLKPNRRSPHSFLEIGFYCFLVLLGSLHIAHFSRSSIWLYSQHPLSMTATLHSDVSGKNQHIQAVCNDKDGRSLHFDSFEAKNHSPSSNASRTVTDPMKQSSESVASKSGAAPSWNEVNGLISKLIRDGQSGESLTQVRRWILAADDETNHEPSFRSTIASYCSSLERQKFDRLLEELLAA